MKLIFKILNGPRRGMVIDLNPLIKNKNSEIYFLEDEALEISFYADRYFDEIDLNLYENVIKPTRIEENGFGEWIYKWEPKKNGKNFYECFFHNFHGVAQFFVKFQYDDIEHIIDFEPIDVLAKKINAERINDMLEFLAKKDSDILCSFFRVTRRKAGYQYGNTLAEIILERLENTVNKVREIINKIFVNPITKLNNKESYVFPTDSTNIDDITLAWLCDNTDELYETDNIQTALLEYDQKYYHAVKIRENSLVNDTNVYENQIIHGFISTLILSASTLLDGFEIPKTKKEAKDDQPDGYVSFYSQIRKFHVSINKRKVVKCKEILMKLHLLNKKIHEKLPVTRKVFGIPIVTMKAKNNSFYLSFFKKIVEWSRYGKPDWSIQEELLSIQNIPKLFEYYNLFYIKEILDIRFKNTSITEETNTKKIHFNYIENGFNISLHYEPKYWSVNHPNANLQDLVNSEAWYISHGKINRKLGTGVHSNRCPDFVITIKNINGVIKSFILDAKYTNSVKVFSDYLPELTLKYLHGLSSIHSTQEIVGLMLINPDSNPHIKHFHCSTFNIFSNFPVKPYMMCASINPGDEFNKNKNFEEALNRIIDLIFSSMADHKKEAYKALSYV